MAIKYGLAEFDRYTGKVDWNINLPMEGVAAGELYEFLENAGANGWELCSSFPNGVTGAKRHIPNQADTRECKEPSEQIAFIFKRIS